MTSNSKRNRAQTKFSRVDGNFGRCGGCAFGDFEEAGMADGWEALTAA